MNPNNFENDPFVIKHRKRTSKKQLEVLEKTFVTCIRPDAKLRKKLGDQLGMTPRAVQIWFQNRRAKIKKTTGEYKTKKKTSERSIKDGMDESYNSVYESVPSQYYEDMHVQYSEPKGFRYSEPYFVTQYQRPDPYNMMVPGYYDYQYSNENMSPISGNTNTISNLNIPSNINIPKYPNIEYPSYENIYSGVYHNIPYTKQDMYQRMYSHDMDGRVGYPPQGYEGYYYEDQRDGEYSEKKE